MQVARSQRILGIDQRVGVGVGRRLKEEIVISKGEEILAYVAVADRMAGVQGRFEDGSESLLGSGSIFKIRIAFLQTFFRVIHFAEGEISDFILGQPAKRASFGHQGKGREALVRSADASESSIALAFSFRGG